MLLNGVKTQTQIRGEQNVNPGLGVCSWHGQLRVTPGRKVFRVFRNISRERDVFSPLFGVCPYNHCMWAAPRKCPAPHLYDQHRCGEPSEGTLPPSSCPHDPASKDRLARSYQPFPLELQNKMLMLPFHPYCPSEHETKITTAVSCLKWKWQHFFFRKVFYHLPFHQWHRDSENQLMQSSQISTNPTDAGNLWQKNFIPWRKFPNS